MGNQKESAIWRYTLSRRGRKNIDSKVPVPLPHAKHVTHVTGATHTRPRPTLAYSPPGRAGSWTAGGCSHALVEGEAALAAQHGVSGAAANCRATSGHLLATWGSTLGVPATALIVINLTPPVDSAATTFICRKRRALKAQDSYPSSSWALH